MLGCLGLRLFCGLIACSWWMCRWSLLFNFVVILIVLLVLCLGVLLLCLRLVWFVVWRFRGCVVFLWVSLLALFV